MGENETELKLYWWNAAEVDGVLTYGNIQTMKVKI